MRFKKGLALATASALTLSAMTGCANKVGVDKYSTTVGATYGDEKIYLDEILFYTKLEQESMDYMYDMYKAFGYFSDMSREQFYDALYTEDLTAWQVVKESVVSTIYQTHVLNDYAKDNNIALSDKDLEKVEEEVKEFTEGEHKYLLDGTNISEETIRRIITQNALANRAHDQMGEGYDKEVDREQYQVAHAYYFSVAKDDNANTNELDRAWRLYSKFEDAYEKAEKDITKVDLDKIKADLAEPEGTTDTVTVYKYEDTGIFVGQVAATKAQEENKTDEDATITQPTELQKTVAEMTAGQFKLIEDANAYYVLFLSEEDNDKSTQEKIDAEYATRKEAKFVENYAELLKTAKEIKVNTTSYDANIVYKAINYPVQEVTTTEDATPEATTAEATTAEATTAEVPTAEATTAEATTAEAPTEEATTEEASAEDATTGEEATEEEPTEEVTEEATEEPAVEATEEVAPTDAE